MGNGGWVMVWYVWGIWLVSGIVDSMHCIRNQCDPEAANMGRIHGIHIQSDMLIRLWR